MIDLFNHLRNVGQCGFNVIWEVKFRFVSFSQRVEQIDARRLIKPWIIVSVAYCNQKLLVFYNLTVQKSRPLIESFGYCHHFYAGPKDSIKRRTLYLTYIFIAIFLSLMFFCSHFENGNLIYGWWDHLIFYWLNQKISFEILGMW